MSAGVSVFFAESRTEALLRHLENSNLPPWRPVPSRTLAKLLGVSLQVLANWRVRETGPKYLPRQKGKGNRLFYRLDDVMAWLSRELGSSKEPWEFDRDWLDVREMRVHSPSKEAIEWFIGEIDRGHAFRGLQL